MGYQVVLSPAAEADLDEILTYIAGDNPEAAAKFGTAIIRLAFSLAEMPLRGRLFRRRSQFRRLIHGDYLIIYRIKETDRVVEVLRFWHGARRPPKL
jgi:toxin ParE1/3/4